MPTPNSADAASAALGDAPRAQAAAPGPGAPARSPSSGVRAVVQEAQAPADPLVGTTIDGRYLVERVLGEGGMGVVYAAMHRHIERRVALKILRPEVAHEREVIDRFIQEAKTASSIGNPHIVDVLDFGVLPDGSQYLAMEFLEGKSLTDVLVERMEPARIASIAMQICEGLGAAHERGIVHRDLKPDNVLLVDRGGTDFVKLLDFGIAKVSGEASQKITRAGAVFGTPHYMSPEQSAGTPVDHRADIYALGVMLYEMLSGQVPFDSDNFMSILTQHMYKAPDPIRSLAGGATCPPALEAIVQKSLEKRPELRYQSMEDLGEDLRRFVEGEAPVAVQDVMSRAGQTGVPADYFKVASAPAALPPGAWAPPAPTMAATAPMQAPPVQTPAASKGHVALYLVIAASLAVIAGSLGILWHRQNARNDAKPQPVASATPSDPSAVAAQPAPSIAAPPATSDPPPRVVDPGPSASVVVEGTKPEPAPTARTFRAPPPSRPPPSKAAPPPPSPPPPQPAAAPRDDNSWDSGPQKVFKR